MLKSIVWSRNSTKITSKEQLKDKSKMLNGKNGKKTKRGDLIKLKKKLKKLIKKMTNNGKSSIKRKKSIGNKRTTLIGLNGKWRLKPERWMTKKEKGKDSCTKKRKRKEKKKNNFKSISDKSNSATTLLLIWRTFNKTKTSLKLRMNNKTKNQSILALS